IAMLYVFTGSRDDAEDIAQEAFVRMLKRWGHINRYDSPEAWIRLVATRLALSRRRNLTRQRTAPSADIDTEPAAPQDPGQRLDLEQLVRHLSREQREAVVLHYLCDLSIQETANTLGTTQSAIKNRLLRARDQLAQMMPSLGPAVPDWKGTDHHG
ncbi:MAG TPA: sigma-70 family RNA polymerase sigma factor, partial [Nocardioides sp.]